MEAIDSRDEEAPLVDENRSPTKAPKKNHARDVHILCAAFLLIFLAYGAAQNLESTINTVRDLSPWFCVCLCVLGLFVVF